MIKKLAPFMRRYRVPAILCPVAIILEVIIDVSIPLLMADIVDRGIPNQDVALITRTGMLMIGLALFALLVGVSSSWLASTAAMGFGSEIRKRLFSRIQTFSFARLDKFGVPTLITRLTNDVNNVQNLTMMGLRMAFRAPFMMIMALVLAIRINSSLAMVFFVAIPILTVGLGLIMSNAYPRFRALQRKLDKLNSTVQENLISIRVVKAFVRSTFEKDRFRNANQDLRDRALKAIRLVILNGPMMQLAIYACIIAVLWFGGGMVRSGDMLTGQLISFISYVNQILRSLMMLSMVFIFSVRAKASGERVIEILETDSGMIEPDPETLEMMGDEVQDGSVEFRSVEFRYSEEAEQNVLSDISFKIRSGETIGIIGATGSGKTSLVSLIPRLYDATAGEILVGGRDVRDYSLKTLRDAVAVVLQNNTLFTGTIRENLQWGKEDANDEELMAVCQTAQAAEFIEEMPEGLDTMLGQGGVNLSGGQKQRLCIARALLKYPKIIILDDSTSAVDTATDRRLRQGFAETLQDVTVIIIAQRINSIQHADRILVLDDGRINGIGTHDELMEQNEIYRDVYNSQQEGVKDQ
ncbi:MAG: ABC transporter ATP-binding protein [Saccharofermentanales bacterium]|jgi:ATP-binding cassette subfamily B multidrug efflux pump|nr:ABC transporter ATP-binding protein [Clostridiaceae bacterium]